ncbi:uncharacterized protein PAC_03495 [Phialocephala subalpina]|uniref:Lysine-specific metallo-endopeptidase domain-containing protein n=1 Tax=Phialocephala subalpina TaxID=576137 RepID=A0A1L7WLH5_9HELO|nr:uncharacterized protein PAC_03495 [Phialocephala subalpina]
MMHWFFLGFPVVYASVLPSFQPSSLVSGLQDSENQLAFFSQGLKVDQHYLDPFPSQKGDGGDSNNGTFPTLARRYVYETTAPKSTVWQGVNGVQWDQWSQDVVVKAWALMMEMAVKAPSDLTDLTPSGPSYQLFQSQTTSDGICQAMMKDPTRSTPAYLLCYRTFIAANNYAYGQLFGADPENIDFIIANFERIDTELENLQSTGGTNPGADGFIRAGNLLYLTMGPTLHALNGANICDGGTQAFAVVATGTQEFSANQYVSADAWIIHFCPAFFQLPRMERQLWDLQQGGVPKETICNLNNLDSTARALLHEVTHLPWVLNTNYYQSDPEKYGFYTATSYATDAGGNQATHTKSFSSRNADSYAWMAVYNFWNSVKECQGIKYTGTNQAAAGCNTDVWPSTPDVNGRLYPKLVKNQWNNYVKGN